jgi:hypothetical protein
MVSAQARLMSMFDPRLAQLTAFLQQVSQIDVIAPTYGARRLSTYFEEHASVAAGI